MSRETRIGLLFALAIGVFIFGFKFLKGQNVLSSNHIFYAEYSNVDLLQPSNPIYKNGLQVGIVSDVYMKEDDPNKIVVVMDVDGDLDVPKTAKAVIFSSGVMGGKAIELEYSKNCSGADCAESGEFLQGTSKGLVSSMLGEPSEVQEYVDVVKNTVTELVDTLSEKVDTSSEIGKTFASLQATMNNLELTTARLDRLMARSSGSLEMTLNSVASLTSNLEKSNAKISGIIDNVNGLTANLNQADMGKTVTTATQTMEELKKVMKTADGAVAKLSQVMDKANSNNGSLGKLLNDKELYDNLNQVSRSVTLLTSDIREHPERYRRILSKKTKTEPIREVPEEVEGETGN